MQRAEERLSAGAIPAEGMTLDGFAREVVPFVAPEDVEELLKRLHRRKAVWVSRNRGAVTVYRERPANPTKPMPVAPGEVDGFLGAIVLPMMRVVDALVKDRLADHEGAYAEDVACGRAIDVVRQHAARGSDLAAMRSAMWRLFPERAMRRIAWHEPRLAHDATDPAFAAQREPQRLPGWLTTEERILALIGKAGSRGMTANDLQHSLAPRPSREDMSGELARLKAEGKVTGIATGRQRGRPSVRWVAI